MSAPADKNCPYVPFRSKALVKRGHCLSVGTWPSGILTLRRLGLSKATGGPICSRNDDSTGTSMRAVNPADASITSHLLYWSCHGLFESSLNARQSFRVQSHTMTGLYSTPDQYGSVVDLASIQCVVDNYHTTINYLGSTDGEWEALATIRRYVGSLNMCKQNLLWGSYLDLSQVWPVSTYLAGGARRTLICWSTSQQSEQTNSCSIWPSGGR